MRLAGIEKGGFYPFPNYIVEAVGVAALPGSSRRRRAHARYCSIPAPAKAKSPAFWAGCSTAKPGAVSSSPIAPRKPLPAWTSATAPPGKAAL
jgi:hypothetical protein